IHPRNVNVACYQIAGDLNVSDEAGSAKREIHRGTPGDTVVSRSHDRDWRPGIGKVVKGDVHPPVERRSGIHVAPARLAVAIVSGSVGNAGANGPGDAAVRSEE